MRLVQDAVLTEELLQFLLTAANTFCISKSQPQGLSPFVVGRSVILGYEEDDGFEHSSGASFPVGKEEAVER